MSAQDLESLVLKENQTESNAEFCGTLFFRTGYKKVLRNKVSIADGAFGTMSL